MEHMMNIISTSPDIVLQETAGARLAESAVAAAAGVASPAIRARSRGRKPVANARQRAMYLAHVTFGLSLTRVGACFGRDRTTVRHACALVEDSRDDPRCELGLDMLEEALLAIESSLALRSREVL
ncbi:MAG: chromosomal replication initiator DnaA [Bosea sp.]|nr:chromosomal replication initiator DnaA [Bosea sp. (in: a-proteobacteria)]